MDVVQVEDVSSVKLFTVKVSEGELELYERCLSYVSQHVPESLIQEISAFERKTVDDVINELRQILINNVIPEFLPKRYQDMKR